MSEIVVDYFYSHASPWAYLGHAAFLEMARRNGVKVAFRPVALGPVFDETGGLPLGKRHPARLRYRLIELQRWHDKRHMPINLQPAYFPFDPSLADRCAIAIQAAGRSPAEFSRRAFLGAFAYDKNVADDHVVEGMLGDAGEDGHAIFDAAKSDAVTAAYEQNKADAIAAGVVGSPCYVLNGEPFWGQDRIELLEDAIRSGRHAYTA
ncbi:MAG: 2-hydroxychromene-2-carboxylate isomerase [Hyphomicrobiales bacterium]|nr:MAG: 2-hydroxychromene-2-carboxylate isomerase [Hyphomicrobiales bacterium]